MKPLLILLLGIFILLFFQCSSTSWQQRMNVHVVNQALVENDFVQLITNDGAEYLLQISFMDSSLLKGEGKYRQTLDSDWDNFYGELPVDSVNMVALKKSNFLKGLFKGSIIVGSAALLTDLWFKASDEEDEPNLAANMRYTGPTDISSCPFIYSWDGEKYVLDAEAIGVAWGKGLELTTCSILPSLKEEGRIKIKITNERLETHYLNSLRLLAIPMEINTIPVLDNENIVWPVRKPEKPNAVIDHSGRNVVHFIETKDQKYWSSDLESANIKGNFEDYLDLKFALPWNAKKGLLIVNAINTELSNQVFAELYELLGNKTLHFINEVENDPNLISTLKNWIEESSLKAHIKIENKWVKIGKINPVANVTPFTKAISFDLTKLPLKTDTLTVRLSCLTDVWEINAVNIDWTADKPLSSYELPIESIRGPKQINYLTTLRHNDDVYATLLPPDYLEISAYNKQPGEKIYYALSISGYMHEWIPENYANKSDTFINYIPEKMKIDFVKELLKNKNLFLPSIYQEWKKIRQSQIKTIKHSRLIK
jgi:hypothetical protein